MDDLARRVLVRYCQSWGQTVEEKIEVLNEAVRAAGINAVFKQYEEDGELIAGWEGSQEDTERASQFRQDLETGWWKGSFEEEAAFIGGLIAKYANQALNPPDKSAG